jgi:hypothetical protein
MEILAVVQTPEGTVWGPFCRKEVEADQVPQVLEEELAKLGKWVGRVVETGWRGEKLFCLSITGLSSRPVSKNE